MQNLYKGGQCNPNAIASSSNHYKRMMDQLSIGSQNPQRMHQHIGNVQSLEGDIANRQAMFKNMNSQWNQSTQLSTTLPPQMLLQMNQQFRQAQQMQQAEIMVRQAHWAQAHQNIQMDQALMAEQFASMTMQQQAQQWANQLQMNDQFDRAVIFREEQQASIQSSTGNMLEVMANDPDPRFQGSKFLHFLKRIKQGELVIEGKELKEVKPDEKLMEGAWKTAENQHQKAQEMMNSAYSTAQQQQETDQLNLNDQFENHWSQRLQDYEKQLGDSENYEKLLQQKYMEVLKEMNLDMTQAWQSATDMQEQLVNGEVVGQYRFSKENPYLGATNPKEIALTHINTGLNNQAVLALEAHLQQNITDAQSWRILGRVLQENDQDQKSITCFLNCLKNDENNLDSLLSLGVSCANTLNEVKAMNFLKRWIILNPKYAALNVDPNIIPEQMVNQSTYTIETIKQFNHRLIDVFQAGLTMNPNDPQLLTATGVLMFVKRDYHESIGMFQRALAFDPSNYLLMNKVGATLAHLGRAQQAIDLYHQALDIRPNFVRAWVNTGIAHAYLADYQQAARLYLNALSFRPDAKHIWSYLHTCFMSLQRYDLIQKISTQDPLAFSQFDVIRVNDLPAPAIDYTTTTERHILNKPSEVWLRQHK